MRQVLHQRHLPATASGTHFPALAAGLPGLSCPGSTLLLTCGGGVPWHLAAGPPSHILGLPLCWFMPALWGTLASFCWRKGSQEGEF